MSCERCDDTHAVARIGLYVTRIPWSVGRDRLLELQRLARAHDEATFLMTLALRPGMRDADFDNVIRLRRMLRLNLSEIPCPDCARPRPTSSWWREVITTV